MTKEQIFDSLKEIILTIKPKIDLAKVTMDSSLVTDLGIDSLSMLLLSLATENKFGFQFGSQEQFQTVGQVVDYVEKAIS